MVSHLHCRGGSLANRWITQPNSGVQDLWVQLRSTGAALAHRELHMQEFARLYTQQPLPEQVVPEEAVVEIGAATAPAAATPVGAPVAPAADPVAPQPAAGPAPALVSDAATPPAAAPPTQTARISPAEAAGENSNAPVLLRQAPGQELVDSAGPGGSNNLPESTLVATLAAAAVLAVFLVALLLFVSRHKARRRRKVCLPDPCIHTHAGGASCRTNTRVQSVLLAISLTRDGQLLD